jgi:superfamily II DNA or RNA helicase
MAFQKAVKRKLKARVAICGPTGSGKTFTGLRLLRALVGPQGKLAVIDTENRTAAK